MVIKMKNSIINILKENKNQLITGSYIAKELNITRSYVNKVIQSLIDDGYDIENISRSGKKSGEQRRKTLRGFHP